MIDRGDGVHLAARLQAGRGPTLVFLPGYMSDMSGSKAQYLLQWAKETGRQCLLLDYSGCGASEGSFDDGSITRWATDVKLLADRLAPGPLLPVGSSMGGWVMLRLAQMLGDRLHALVGIAAAPDFTRWGLTISDEEAEALKINGFFTRPSDYADSPYRYCRDFIEDAAQNLFLEAPIDIGAPVRLLHGTADNEVPVDVSMRLMQQLQSDDVRVTIVKDGTHRLSEPGDLDLLRRTIEELTA